MNKNQIYLEPINDEFSRSVYSGMDVIVMNKNGYINATKICSIAKTKNGQKKAFNHWKENTDSQQLLNKMSEELDIPKSELLILVNTGSKNLTIIRGTYVHPLLITHIAYWISPSFSVKVGLWIDEWKSHSKKNELFYYEALSQLDSYNHSNKEKTIQSKLKKHLGGKIEVPTPVGKIDLLTKDKLIEIKKYDDWKCALGQLIAYSSFQPDKKKVLYLFDVGDKKLSVIKKICKDNDIKVIKYD